MKWFRNCLDVFVNNLTGNKHYTQQNTDIQQTGKNCNPSQTKKKTVERYENSANKKK